jgi:putative iron-dependent peroxidase
VPARPRRLEHAQRRGLGRAIGRTKLADIELPDDVKPGNSRVALTTIVDEHGEERQIVRESMPFGHVDSCEFGTSFIGYAAEPDVTETMLRNMFVGRPPGNYERILDFSRAVTGSLFFVPSAEWLDDPPGAGAAGSPTEEEDPGNGSLGIGDQRPE